MKIWKAIFNVETEEETKEIIEYVKKAFKVHATIGTEEIDVKDNK